MWWENERITIHIAVINALRSVGYELRNTIIWNRLNIVNKVGIFGWPSNYITMGTTFEYILDFWRPEMFVVLNACQSAVEDTMPAADDTEVSEVEVETMPIDEQAVQLPKIGPLSSAPESKSKSHSSRKRKSSQNVPPVENMLDQLNGHQE